MKDIGIIFKIALSWCVLLKYKIIYGERFSCCMTDMLSPSVKIRLSEGGKLVLGKKVGIRENVIINATGGTVHICDKVFINDFVCINSREHILIGQNTVIGQGVKMYDHDHDYKHDMQNDFLCSSVEIGHDVWIGSDAIILRGSKIGGKCVVGATSLVKGTVESAVVYINERKERIIKIP